jgi:MHS family proline/betaine transporter-like MFS transporter
MNLNSRQSFLGAALGSMVEYYDYALFSTFLPILAPLFFPAESVYQSLEKAFTVLLITMIARPLGALFFGYFGDAVGRRTALLTSMYGIAFATIILGITPTYASIGTAAIVIVLIAKAVQTFCFGGEFNGGGIYVVELAQNQREGFTSSLFIAICLSGSIGPSAMGIWLTAKDMPSWVWRIAFLIGGVIGLIGISYRKKMIESPHFQPASGASLSTLNLLKKFPRELLAGIFLGGFATVPFATIMVFINPVLMTKGLLTMQQLMIMQTGLTVLGILALVPAGYLADKTTPAKTMALGSWFLILLSYPILYIVDQGNMTAIVIALSAFIIINELVLGPTNAFFKNLFPMQYRYRGSSLGFCLGMSILGGATPLVESHLYDFTKHFTMLTPWLMFIGLGALITIRLCAPREESAVGLEIVNTKVGNS